VPSNAFATKIGLETPDLTAHPTILADMAIALLFETSSLAETERGPPWFDASAFGLANEGFKAL
jgi:hypothetical protein